MNKTTYFQKNAINTINTLVVLFTFSLSFGQTTVFEDNFNRADLSPGGSPSVSYTTLSLLNDRTPQSSGTASYAQLVTSMPSGGSNSDNSPAFSLNDECLNLLQGGTAESGTIQITAPINAYSAPFNPVLNQNTQEIEWSFNVRTNRGNATGSGLSGFSLDGSGTNYGIIAVLAASSTNLMEGNTGYAVTFHQLNSSSSNIVTLRRFADGAYSCSSGCPTNGSTMTTIIGTSTPNYSQTPLANRWNFVSVKVTYNPSNDEWNLYVKDDGDGTTLWSGASTLNSTNLVGTTIDNTYTSDTMTTFGFYFKHGVSNVNQNQAFFDNYKVVLNPTLSSENFDFVTTKLYPNPTNNQLTITSKTSFNSVEISNLLGQKIKEFQNTSKDTQLTIDVSDLQKATYILKLNSAEGIATTKFVKN